MANLLMLAQASAYFGFFLASLGFLWWVSLYAKKVE
jgi:hypothetical protein